MKNVIEFVFYFCLDHHHHHHHLQQANQTKHTLTYLSPNLNLLKNYEHIS